MGRYVEDNATKAEFDLNSFYANLGVLAMGVLKRYSSKARPLKPGDVVKFINEQFAEIERLAIQKKKKKNAEKKESSREITDQRAVLKALNYLVAITHDEESSPEYIFEAFGGRIIRVKDSQSKATSRPNYLYYFEPVLDDSELSMIAGAVESCRYLSDAEKKYLIDFEKTLGSGELKGNEDLSTNYVMNLKAPKSISDRKADHSNPEKKDDMLLTVDKIYKAIRDKIVIRTVYGEYDLVGDGTRPQFFPKNPDKPYWLCPHALLWSGGQYYLIATHYGYKNPAQFRVDRIFSIQFAKAKDTEKSKDGFWHFKSRPDTIKAFYKKGSFDAAAYLRKYPMMTYPKVSRPEIVRLKCDAKHLPLLIDTFGNDKDSNMRIRPAGDDMYEIEISGVEYDCMRIYATMNSEFFTVTAPDDLKNDVKEMLQKSVDEL